MVAPLYAGAPRLYKDALRASFGASTPSRSRTNAERSGATAFPCSAILRLTMWEKLKALTRLERITLILFVIVVINAILDYFTGYQIYGGDLLDVLFVAGLIILFIRSGRSMIRSLLWRLRNRLLVSYVLFGVVPLVLIGLMVMLGLEVLFGQIAANLVRTDVEKYIDQNYDTARDLALSREVEAELRQKFPRLRAIIRTDKDVSFFPPDAELREMPEWSTPGSKVLLQVDKSVMIAAHAQEKSRGHTVDVFAYTPFDTEMLAQISPGLGTLHFLRGNAETTNGMVKYSTDGNPRQIKNVDPQILAKAERALPPARGFWDWQVGWVSLWTVKSPNGKDDDTLMTGVTRPSLVIPPFFSTLGQASIVIAYFLLIIACVFIVVELVSLITSLTLTRTITRAVHDLYVGTKQVASGDLSHRIPVRKKDQLSELAGSFNNMTERIQHLIVEVKEKEKLEAELVIAHEVQAQLFPKGVPHMKRLELAGICNPARVVSGDYYDFVPVGKNRMAIVIGDISGKGISAALLMASVQSSLHAQLTALDGEGATSTATLVTRLNHQLYENTSPEKYATFYCAMYHDLDGRLAYTNAGHLPPILVREGKASRLEGNGTVVGLLPEAFYEQSVIDLKPGDVLAAFTDGITESENAAGEQFGDQRLANLLVENATRPLDEIVKIVIEAVRGWASNLDDQDDTTMLLARRV
jgi:sigma-B regulation protein RsbU (phosphoserine phosphatase)